MGSIRTALVDADIITFKAAASSETSFDWGSDGVSIEADPDVALFKCNEDIANIKSATGATDVVLCFSGVLNFRYDALATYKHNRKGKRRPKLLGPLKTLLMDRYDYECENRLEADDLLGILQEPDGSTCICTIDKDLDQIQGPHFNWLRNEVYDVDPRDALWFRWLQVLTGDSTDGYTGIPRVGPAKAKKILDPLRDDGLGLTQQANEYASATWDAYESKGISRDDYIAQVAVAQILTKDMWDPEAEQVLTEYRVY